MTTLRKKVPTFITNIELYGQESRKISFVGFMLLVRPIHFIEAVITIPDHMYVDLDSSRSEDKARIANL